MGVKATPACPVDNFTPVKKIPMTKSSTRIFSIGIGHFPFMISIVSATTEVIINPKTSF
jgi:hypothetical protein